MPESTSNDADVLRAAAKVLSRLAKVSCEADSAARLDAATTCILAAADLVFGAVR